MTFVILIDHASAPIRKERLSPTMKARREASRNECGKGRDARQSQMLWDILISAVSILEFVRVAYVLYRNCYLMVSLRHSLPMLVHNQYPNVRKQ